MTLEERVFRGIWWPAGFGCAAMVVAAILLTVLAAQLDGQVEAARGKLDSLVRLEKVAVEAERELEERLMAGEPVSDDVWNKLRRALPTTVAEIPGVETDSVSMLARLADEGLPLSTDMLANLSRARMELRRSVLAGHEALNRSYKQTHPRLLAGLALALGINGIAVSVAYRWRKRILKPLGALARELSNLERGRPFGGLAFSDQHALRPLFVSCERIAARVDAIERPTVRTPRGLSE